MQAGRYLQLVSKTNSTVHAVRLKSNLLGTFLLIAPFDCNCSNLYLSSLNAFTVEMFMTLTLTFRLGQGLM